MVVHRSLGGVLHGLGHLEHGVHVDAGAQARHVDRRAHVLGGGKRLGDGVDKAHVGVADALLHQRAETAHEVDAHGLGRTVHGLGKRREIPSAGGRSKLGHGGDRDALVDDRDAVFALELVCHGHKTLSGVRKALVDLASHNVDVLIGAAHGVDAHGDGANVEVLRRDHVEGLADFLDADTGHGCLLAYGALMRTLKPNILFVFYAGYITDRICFAGKRRICTPTGTNKHAQPLQCQTSACANIRDALKQPGRMHQHASQADSPHPASG